MHLQGDWCTCTDFLQLVEKTKFSDAMIFLQAILRQSNSNMYFHLCIFLKKNLAWHPFRQPPRDSVGGCPYECHPWLRFKKKPMDVMTLTMSLIIAALRSESTLSLRLGCDGELVETQLNFWLATRRRTWHRQRHCHWQCQWHWWWRHRCWWQCHRLLARQHVKNKTINLFGDFYCFLLFG